MFDNILILLSEVMLLLALALGLLLMASGGGVDLRKRINRRFSILSLRSSEAVRERSWLERLNDRFEAVFVRAGLQIDGQRLWAGLIAAGVLVGMAVLRYGPGAGVSVLAILLVALYVFLQYSYRKRAAMLLAQLPRFVDNLERSLAAGHSLQNALAHAAERAADPLREVLLRVKNNVDLGGELGEQLQMAANTMAVKEFQLLALAMDVHQRYGGSVKSMLQSIATMVKQNEQARREFAALTGETRFSAWVLGAMPLLIAGYMAMMNPGYMDTLWNTDSGRAALYVAVGLQAAGVLILWRMIRSI